MYVSFFTTFFDSRFDKMIDNLISNRCMHTRCTRFLLADKNNKRTFMAVEAQLEVNKERHFVVVYEDDVCSGVATVCRQKFFFILHSSFHYPDRLTDACMSPSSWVK